MAYGKPFPQYLSKPYQVLWFEFDDMVIIYASALLFGVKIGGWAWLLVPAITYGYTKLKANYPRGFLKHCAYFLGANVFRGYPTFFQQRFYE